MEQGDATATIGLQDALELLPQELHRKMLPANRTFVLRRTSKTMCAAVENAKLDTVVVRTHGVKFPNGAGLQDKFNLSFQKRVVRAAGQVQLVRSKTRGLNVVQGDCVGPQPV